jgi:hypothetical protein
MLREDEALVDREQSEDDPEVEEDCKQALELIEGLFFKSALPRNCKDLIRHGGTPRLPQSVVHPVLFRHEGEHSDYRPAKHQ